MFDWPTFWWIQAIFWFLYWFEGSVEQSWHELTNETDEEWRARQW